eukprot:UN06533
MFVGHRSDVECVKFHPNCNYIGTGSSDRTCRLWDIQTGNLVRLYVGHNNRVNTVAFSPNGKYIASGSDDGDIFVWDIS